MGLLFFAMEERRKAADCICLRQPSKSVCPRKKAVFARFVCSGQIVDNLVSISARIVYAKSLKVKLGVVKMSGLCPFAPRLGGVPSVGGALQRPIKTAVHTPSHTLCGR